MLGGPARRRFWAGRMVTAEGDRPTTSGEVRQSHPARRREIDSCGRITIPGSGPFPGLFSKLPDWRGRPIFQLSAAFSGARSGCRRTPGVLEDGGSASGRGASFSRRDDFNCPMTSGPPRDRPVRRSRGVFFWGLGRSEGPFPRRIRGGGRAEKARAFRGPALAGGCFAPDGREL